MNKLEISKIKNLNTIVIKQAKGGRFFISTPNSFIISIPNFATLIRFLILNKFMSRKVLEGILSEITE
ncbi:hypothetical protein LCGC14_1208490 [marine sediment metagenome]|uniref:Uncharacterized protein n=1 Tax=marine sediment metagenome TaxID=412755 RepID=A0A0F9PJF7_9ZZZZ